MPVYQFTAAYAEAQQAELTARLAMDAANAHYIHAEQEVAEVQVLHTEALGKVKDRTEYLDEVRERLTRLQLEEQHRVHEVTVASNDVHKQFLMKQNLESHRTAAKDNAVNADRAYRAAVHHLSCAKETCRVPIPERSPQKGKS